MAEDVMTEIENEIRNNKVVLYMKGENMSDFKVPPYKKIEHPSPEQVVQNKEKWGWTG